jgi:hypothetical protein
MEEEEKLIRIKATRAIRELFALQEVDKPGIDVFFFFN